MFPGPWGSVGVLLPAAIWSCSSHCGYQQKAVAIQQKWQYQKVPGAVVLNTCIMTGQVHQSFLLHPSHSLRRMFLGNYGSMGLSAQTKAALVPCFMKGIYSKVGLLTGTDWQCMPAERREAVCARVSPFCMIGTSRAGLSVERLSLLSLSRHSVPIF